MRSIRILLFLLVCFSVSQASLAEDKSTQQIRIASFNIAMGLNSKGDLHKRLQSGDDEALQKVAATIQIVRPDILLINEFDWSGVDSMRLFVDNYLDSPQYGNDSIQYSYSLTDGVNTGLDSGLDLNNNGELSDAADAWGFGHFHGQFGMAVFSRFPVKLKRSFQLFKWKDMPGALQVLNEDGSFYYPEVVREQLRLSSKSHWDVGLTIEGQNLHFLVSHPTPPVFDGPEDRNGLRNHDEIRLWADYIDPQRSGYLYDDTGIKGGLIGGEKFVIAGDLNADPVDGESFDNAIGQLLDHRLINSTCVPASDGAVQSSETQGGKNLEHKGNPAFDTGDFNDKYVGNMRIDYVLPSVSLKVLDCGVFWPTTDETGHNLIDVSDHHLVWIDIEI
jgi:hypothetical protein